jgi:uncharacterized protein (TIGR02598 family)
MKIRTSSLRTRPHGFTLVEVTLALAIAAFGITTIMGLLPHGLNNVRTAGEITAASRISQHILGSLDQSQTTDTQQKQRYYFDAYAVPVDPAGRAKGDIAFVAEVGVPATNVLLPGNTGVNDAFLRRVTVKLKQTPVADFDFTAALPDTYKLYSYVVARTGK